MAETLGPMELKLQLANNAVTLLDVRRSADVALDPATIEGAQWRDPEQVDAWEKDVPKDRPVVIYCVRGGSVSRSVLAALRAKGHDAHFLEGGFEAWKGATAS